MILHWAYQWKMYFNPDFCKQAPKLTFSSKSSRVDHRSITSNNSSVARTSCQKQEKISKACKGIDVIRKLHYVLPRHSLLTIYKSFIRPHLDYGDIIYGQPNNQDFIDKLKVVQYSAVLAITGAI